MNNTSSVGTDLKKPNYQETSNEVEIFRECHRTRLPVLIKGPTGCGKSRFVDYMSHELGLPLITVACNEDTTASDLIGRFLIKGSETVWQDGPLTRAVRTGAILYLDEVIEAREDVVVLIHSLTDYRRILYLDALSETIVAPLSFQLVVSYNPGYQRSFKELKASTRQRFVALDFHYPKPEVEAMIIVKETEIDEKTAKNLVSLAQKIRSLSELGLTESASTRLLVNTAHLIKSGVNSRAAATVAIANSLSDEAGAVKALKDLVSLYL